jgi:lysophospholipase L1-like esterase
MLLNSQDIVSKPRLLFRPDPVIGWSLTPGYGVKVAFRDGLIQHIGGDGWRHIPDRPQKGTRVAIYGCSFTYGTGLADYETYTALLQRHLPKAKILNRGIGGHGTVQNLLQLRRDIKNKKVDAAVFSIISDHRFRNIAHPQRMRQYLNRDWYKLGVEHVPVARISANGRARIIYHSIWQPVIKASEFDIFLPDDYMINCATLAVLEQVLETAQAANIPIRFVLLDALDPQFSRAVMNRFPDTKDISTPYDNDHTFLPDDIHPNVLANQLFADRLAPVVLELIDLAQTEGAQ